jgi:integrase
MSIYKRPGSKTYTYDFYIEGVRFQGRSEETTERGAKAWLKTKRLEAAKEVADMKRLNAPRTWGDASSRYWFEVGKHHVNAAVTAMNLDWLTQEIGDKTAFVAITDNVVASLVAKRRAEMRKVGNAKTVKRAVSMATVNRTMTEQLRKVWLRARDVWKVPVGEVIWKLHMLEEPQERVREASQGEEDKIMSGLGRGYDDAVAFAFLTGCRRMEIIGLKKTDVDFFTRQFTVTGKGGRTRLIPMSDQIYEILWRQRLTPTANVFTYEAARTSPKRRLVKGERYAMTDAGLRTAMRRAVEAAGIETFRFHDTRHTAATRVLRASNLRVVQKLLGHTKIDTTTKYAHAMQEDIRAALNAAGPVKSPADRKTDVEKTEEMRDSWGD